MYKLSFKHYALWFALAALAALVLFESSTGKAHAATINVTCDVTALKNAIATANGDSAADVLNLASNCTYTLTTVDNSSPDANGLPVISTDMTFNGNNAIIERSSAGGTPAFRLMQIEAGVPVHMNQLTIQNGLAGNGSSGGGIWNGGVLTLDSVTLSNDIIIASDAGMGGGAIYNANGTVAITNSTLKNNQLQGYGYRVTGGGAIWSEGTLSITNSHFDTNSSANASPWPWNGGGAMYINGGTVTIDGTSFTNNTSPMGGGAITFLGDLQVTDSTFTSNSTGGGPYGAGAISSLGTLTLNNTAFTLNSVTAVNSIGPLTVTASTFANNTGGGIVTGRVADVSDSHFSGNIAQDGAGIMNGGTLTVSGSEFAQNEAAQYGGGISNGGKLNVANSSFHDNSAAWGAGIMNQGTAVIANSTFTTNHATLYGGGLANYKGTVQVRLSTFTQNHADERGGGLASLDDQYAKAKLTINKSTIANNDAKWGGGVYEGGGTLHVNNSTLANNHAIGAKGYGGGIYMTGGRIGNSTFANNVADRRGGGIWNSGKSDILNVTLFENQAKRGASIYNDQQSITLKNTILAYGKLTENCAVRLGSVINGGHNLNTDTSCALGPARQARLDINGLQDNGGPTLTIGLRAASPAVDAGDDAVCAAAPILGKDQRGVKRPQGAHCDIGAYELKQ